VPTFGDVPILGQQQPSGPPEIHDTEIIEAEKIIKMMQDKAHARVNYQAWNDEMTERMAAIGFLVDIKWWHTNVDGTKSPVIEIIGRTGRQVEFDHDRQRHEVVHDVLDFGEGGIISTKDGSAQQALADKAHGHDH
jgi:hypothetical protein